MIDSSDHKSNVTIMDVAEAAGVSHTTVSRVLNGHSSVSEDTRQRVLIAVKELGYVANLHARNLRGGQTRVIAASISHLDAMYTVQVLRGIDDELTQNDYSLMLYTTQNREDKEQRVVQFARTMTDGLLVILPLHPEHFIDDLQSAAIPYLLVDYHGSDNYGPSVRITNWQGAYDATRHLLELGHRHIGYIQGQSTSGSTVDRYEGHRAACKDYGIDLEDGLVEIGDYSMRSGYEAALNLLRRDLRPTAIFASSDPMAYGALDAIRGMGLRVPEDISVVGFDNLSQSAQMAPALTTVDHRLTEMGRMAARMLIEHIEDSDRPLRRIELATRLIVRESSRKLDDTH